MVYCCCSSSVSKHQRFGQKWYITAAPAQCRNINGLDRNGILLLLCRNINGLDRNGILLLLCRNINGLVRNGILLLLCRNINGLVRNGILLLLELSVETSTVWTEIVYYCYSSSVPIVVVFLFGFFCFVFFLSIFDVILSFCKLDSLFALLSSS